MKKLFVFLNLPALFAVLLAGPVYSQINPKRLLIGTQTFLNFASDKSTFNGSNSSFIMGRSRDLQISPQVGCFFMKNAASGMEFSFRYDKDFGQGSTDHSDYIFDRSFTLVPFLRYYFGTGKLKPYLHAGLGPGWRKTGAKNYDLPEVTQKSKIFSYQLKGGLGIFINEHISCDFGFGYEYIKTFYKEPMMDGTYDRWNTVKNGIKTTVGIVVII